MIDLYKLDSISNYRMSKELEYEELDDLLKNEYPRIYDEIEKEGYTSLYKDFDIFIEIKQKEETVGYMIIETIDNLQNLKVLNDFYIMPEYRQKELLSDYLYLLIDRHNFNLLIKKPNIDLVQYLIEHNLAIQLNANLVYSYITFATNAYDVFKNKNLKRYYKAIPSEDNNNYFMGTVYDLNLGCFYFVDEKNIFVKKEYPGISMPHPYDLQKYKLRKKMHKINSSDMTKTVKNLKYYEHKVEEFEKDKKEELSKLIKLEDIIGVKDRYTQEYIRTIKENGLSISDADEIYDKIRQALSEDEIIPQTITTRLKYLIAHPEYNALNTSQPHVDECPYCKNTIYINQVLCEKCGFNTEIIEDDIMFDDEIEYEDFENYYDKESGLHLELYEEVIDKGLNPHEVYKDQLECGLYKFLSFIKDEENRDTLPEFDDIYQIKYGSIIEKALDDDLAVEIERELDSETSKKILETLDQMPEDGKFENIKDDPYYEITSDGEKYLKNHPVIAEFMEYINYLPYYKFKKYYDNSQSEDVQDVISKYIDQTTIEAIEKEDIQLYLDTLRDKVNYYIKTESTELALVYLLRVFIASINKYRLFDKEEEYAYAINTNDEVYLGILLDDVNEYNFDELYNQAYDGIKYRQLKIDKDDIRTYIKSILDGESIDDVNKQITEK